ncbi:subtilase family protease [Candidatus Nitrososphaera evergladensis SR1]|uniref:Subtilase family protease n=1 Tax=Candidatus Nitrososphaera evergladensis SR1 TaxID=1459636 RepID=A0A075N0M6_9ARCH|nr:S8 family serine peptidase [Candidatus Nitrososphaera evergladensis]AIF85029.1 subtilase family protease [Candidatus Nitrososphaera evergladensis SR1]
MSSEDGFIGREVNYHGNDVFYTPIEEFVDFNPRKVFGGKKKVQYAKKSKKELVEDYEKTISRVSNSSIKDDEFAYFLLEFYSNPTSGRYARVLQEMNMTLLAFLDKSQKKALVQSPYADPLEVIVKESREIIKKIRPLDREEKIAPDLVNFAGNATVIVNTIPNIPAPKIEQHMSKIREFIQQHQGEPLNGLIDRENLRGSIIAKVNGETLRQLADDSSVILSVYKVPNVILSALGKRKRRITGDSTRAITASSMVTDDSSSTNRYEVIEIDSGVKILQDFQNHVVPLTALSQFPDGEDKDNHGTPIASLLLFGEGGKLKTSRVKVTSYKAWQESHDYDVKDLYTAMKFVLDNHKGRSRVFVSSLNYTFHDSFSEQETRKLELLIQSKNVCFVNSAGNIDDAASRRSVETRESIWKSARVFHPSDARTITSVGAYCRANGVDNNSYRLYPACFGRHNSEKIANKPEVLEFGGTLAVEGFGSTNIGVMAHSISGQVTSHYGTSMAAPLFARHLALLDFSLRDRVKNCETLKALAYSACKPTAAYDEFGGFGCLDTDELSTTSDRKVRVIFEGVFANMNEHRIPIHEIRIPIMVQPVKVTLFLVHSDNYSLPTTLDNYTAIMVDGTKGQQKLQLVREKGVNVGKWTHVKKAVYAYKKNSIGWWRFRLRPKLDNIPIQELSRLSLRYGGVLVIEAQRPPKGFLTLKEAMERERERSHTATESMESSYWDRYD